MIANNIIRKRIVHRLASRLPLISTKNIEQAVKSLELRYGHGFKKLNADSMPHEERDFVAEQIIRITKARYALGLRPFRPIEPDDDLESDFLPFPYLSPDECLALYTLVEATAKAEGWEDGL